MPYSSRSSIRSGTAAASAAGQTFRQTLAAAGRSSGVESMDSIFEEASATYGVPLKLLKAVAKAESDFNPNAVSKAGASGVMQLMPATARGLGVKNIFDPRENIFGGARYLRERLDEFGGSVELALAAYNAGSNNVRKYGGIPPFQETQNYVRKIMGFLGQNGEISSGRMVTSSRTGTYPQNAFGNSSAVGAYQSYGMGGQSLYNMYGMSGLWGDYGSLTDYSALLNGEMDKDKATYMVELMRLRMTAGLGSLRDEQNSMWL